MDAVGAGGGWGRARGRSMSLTFTLSRLCLARAVLRERHSLRSDLAAPLPRDITEPRLSPNEVPDDYTCPPPREATRRASPVQMHTTGLTASTNPV